MSRPLLYGADGTVMVEEVGEKERMSGLLVEIFGLLIAYKGSAPRPLSLDEARAMIADIVGVERLEERFTGLELEVVTRPHAAGKES